MLYRALVFALAPNTRSAVINISPREIESLRVNIFEDVHSYYLRCQNPEFMLEDVSEYIPKARKGSPLVYVQHANIGH